MGWGVGEGAFYNGRPFQVTMFCSAEYHNVERVIHEAYPCTYFRTKFEHGDFSFGDKENTTFLVYVYGFQTPFWLQVSLNLLRTKEE